MYNENYELYKEARDAAWRTLLECEINSLPIDLHIIIKTLGYKIHKYSNSKLIQQIAKEEVKQGDGFIIEMDEKKHIYINDTIKNYGRRRFTTAHEIGHGVLKHEIEKIHFRHPENDILNNKNELQANIYSRDILAPACVLKELNIYSPEDIMKICLISKRSAQIRSERLNKLYIRKSFYKSPLERELIKNFKEFIKNNS